MTDDQLDFNRLLLLPDVVKRRILGVLDSSTATADPASAVDASRPLQQLQKRAGNSALDACRRGCVSKSFRLQQRAVRLPQLQPGGACVVDGVLSLGEADDVAEAVDQWLQKHGREPGMGSASSGGLWHDAQRRGDVTSWVTEQEVEAAGCHLLAGVLQLLASLKQQLTQQGYDVSGRCSMQLACYPGDGARYIRHADASPSIPHRTVTALLYLNNGWDVQKDGGQLALYNAKYCKMSSATETEQEQAVDSSAGEPALLIAPLAGRLLVFDSRLEHEVLPAYRHRYSITAFFYRGRPASVQYTALPCAGEDQVLLGNQAACNKAEQTNLPTALGMQQTPAVPAAQSAPTTCHQGGTACSTSLPRIFVSIAAFRDEECQWTLRDLFLKAKHPQRVFVGVVWQIDPLADQAFVRMAGGEKTEPYLHQVREVRLHHRKATGPCAARSLTQQLWVGEEYVLQIDAHMRFVEGWDELCLQQLHLAQEAADHERVVLSTYPLGYDGSGPAAVLPDDAQVTLLCAKEFDENGMLRIQGRSLSKTPNGPIRSLFWAAGFSFSSSAWLLEVPYCPHLPYLFFGEEVYMLARMATRGWQVWAPSQPLVFHQWERSTRKNSYQACTEVAPAVRRASQCRVLKLLHDVGEAAVDPDRACAVKTDTQQPCHVAQQPREADWELGGVWGLGTALTMREWEGQLGINFRERHIGNAALFGGHEVDAFQ